MVFEWSGYWQLDFLARFAGFERQSASRQIDVLPSQKRQIPQPLARIEAQFDQALPFWISNGQDLADLFFSEGAPCPGGIVFDHADGFGRILKNVAVQPSCLEQHA